MKTYLLSIVVMSSLLNIGISNAQSKAASKAPRGHSTNTLYPNNSPYLSCLLELSMELGGLLTVIQAAELLGMVNTPAGEVVVEKFGNQVIEGSVTERKELIHGKLQTLPVFKKVREFLAGEKDGEVTREKVLDKLAELIPNEDAESSFSTLVNWGRYSELFGYNDDTQTFYLDQGQNHD